MKRRQRKVLPPDDGLVNYNGDLVTPDQAHSLARSHMAYHWDGDPEESWRTDPDYFLAEQFKPHRRSK